jgi:hypothetical protein
MTIPYVILFKPERLLWTGMAEASSRAICIELGAHPIIIKVPLASSMFSALVPDDDAESDPECDMLGRMEDELSLE